MTFGVTLEGHGSCVLADWNALTGRSVCGFTLPWKVEAAVTRCIPGLNVC